MLCIAPEPRKRNLSSRILVIKQIQLSLEITVLGTKKLKLYQLGTHCCGGRAKHIWNWDWTWVGRWVGEFKNAVPLLGDRGGGGARIGAHLVGSQSLWDGGGVTEPLRWWWGHRAFDMMVGSQSLWYVGGVTEPLICWWSHRARTRRCCVEREAIL